MNKTIKTLAAYGLLLAVGLGIGLVVPRVPGWLVPDYKEGNYSAYFPNAEIQAVIYTTAWCPYCKKTREYMAEHKIRVLEVDIEKSPRGSKQFEALGGGEKIPLVLIGSRRIEGFNPKAYAAALAQLPR